MKWVKQRIAIHIGEVLSQLTWLLNQQQLITIVLQVRLELSLISKNSQENIYRESAFSNVPSGKLYTSIRLVSTMRMFPMKFKSGSFSKQVRTAVSPIQLDQFSHAFARHNALISVFAFQFFSICLIFVYVSLHLCVKCKFN